MKFEAKKQGQKDGILRDIENNIKKEKRSNFIQVSKLAWESRLYKY